MISFPFEPWDPKKDILPTYAGNSVGFAFVEGGIQPRGPVDQRDAVVDKAIDGAIGLLVESLEWLRWYGLSESEIKSRYQRVLRKHTAANSKRDEVLRDAEPNKSIADGQNLKHRLKTQVR